MSRRLLNRGRYRMPIFRYFVFCYVLPKINQRGLLTDVSLCLGIPLSIPSTSESSDQEELQRTDGYEVLKDKVVTEYQRVLVRWTHGLV